MVRILVFGMTENPGGVESFLINYYRYIDRDKFQFDFLCNSHNPVAYEDELIRMGARTFHFTARSKNRKLYNAELKEIFERHAGEWSAIWVNVCSLANIDYLKWAKEYGIKKRIIHSHNSRNMDGRLRGLLHWWNRYCIDKFATDFWACSLDAAKWFYRRKLLDKTIVVHNAIDVRKLKFDETKRKKIRTYLGLESEYVIGNVGRLHFQKNQSFILDIFFEYLKINPNSKLIFVGQGEDEQMLKEKCNCLGIFHKVVFAGVQKNIDEWLSAFDLFLFPSVFEGLGIAALEAQANGIPVLASMGVIPDEVKMNNNFIFYSLDHAAHQWSERVAEIQENVNRLDFEEIVNNFISKGYEITEEVNKLEMLFMQ